MVYEKKKSGDPDFDDKVPMDEHAATVVTAGDGKVIGRIDPVLGPVTPDGAHLNVDVSADDLDTRPAPGDKAEVKAEVQTYSQEDVPQKSVTVEEVRAMESDASTQQSGDIAAAERQEAQTDVAAAPSEKMPPATKGRAAK